MSDVGALRDEPKITPELVSEHGLKPDEYKRVLELIGRTPTLTELGIFSAMWNEHCSYKSSKVHSAHAADQGAARHPGPRRERRRHRHRRWARLRVQDGEPQPPELYRALSGRGDRRRRHPARRVHHGRAADRLPQCACASAPRRNPKTRHLVSGVVAGIGGYGNSFGVPTVGGSVRFHSRYDGNCLVNAMAVGLARKDRIFYAAASGVGMPIVYLGSKTGRDGIHGAIHGFGGIRRGSPRKSARPCRSAIRSRKSCCSKPVSRSWPRAASSPSRTWARRA